MQNLNEKEQATVWHLQQLLRSVDVTVSPMHTAQYLVSQGVTLKTQAEWKTRTVRKQEAPDVSNDFYEDTEVYCSACEQVDDHEVHSKFCPHCGAEMTNAR